MLSDADWREIEALKLKLPKDARSEINNWIDLELRLSSRQKPAVTRGKLKRLHAMSARLERELTTIDDASMMALLDAGSTQKFHAHSLLRERRGQVAAMTSWLQMAVDSIKAAKRGPDGESHEWLARQCAAFLERHNAGRLSRSYKADSEAKFTKIVLQAAARAAGGKPLKSGTGAIRRVARGRISEKNRV